MRMVLEHKRLREHNMTFKSDSLELFLFAEASLILLMLERFLRMILKGRAKDGATLFNLLELATSKNVDLIVLPGMLSTQETIKRISTIRNTLMHANYEEAALTSGLVSKDEYFQSGQFASEIESLYRLVQRIVKQIDTDSGLPHSRQAPAMQAFLTSPDFLDLRHIAADEGFTPVRLVQQAFVP